MSGYKTIERAITAHEQELDAILRSNIPSAAKRLGKKSLAKRMHMIKHHDTGGVTFFFDDKPFLWIGDPQICVVDDKYILTTPHRKLK